MAADTRRGERLGNIFFCLDVCFFFTRMGQGKEN
jgi:hypothetical protein